MTDLYTFLNKVTLVILHCRRKEIVSGGGEGHDKENFFERHYFLRLQKPFSRKVGGTCPPTAPPVLFYINRYNHVAVSFDPRQETDDFDYTLSNKTLN